MSIKVAEAIGSETGGKDGVPGDQTGNEILIRTFKKRSYNFSQVLRCTNRTMAEQAASYAKRIAECSQFGYSQEHRWDGAKQIERVGADNLEHAGAGDFDCSSLVLECYRLAGLPIKMTGYTGNMGKILLGTGQFREANEVLTDIEYAQIGDVFIAPSIHTLIVITDGSKAEHDEDIQPDPMRYVLIKGDNVWVREGPGTTAPKMFVAHKGAKHPYIETDPATGWYWISTPMGTGCITGKTKYTEVI
jgi:cell wall-associated NlpC family hydrolase